MSHSHSRSRKPAFKVSTWIAIADVATKQVIGSHGDNISRIREKMQGGGYIRVADSSSTAFIFDIPANRTVRLPYRHSPLDVESYSARVYVKHGLVPVVLPQHIEPGALFAYRAVEIQGWTAESVKRAARDIVDAAKPQLTETFAPTDTSIVPIMIGTGGRVIKAMARDSGTSCSIFFDKSDGLFVIRASSPTEITKALVNLKSKHDKILFQSKQAVEQHSVRRSRTRNRSDHREVPTGNAFAVLASDDDGWGGEEFGPHSQSQSIWTQGISMASKLEDAAARGETFIDAPDRLVAHTRRLEKKTIESIRKPHNIDPFDDMPPLVDGATPWDASFDGPDATCMW